MKQQWNNSTANQTQSQPASDYRDYGHTVQVTKKGRLNINHQLSGNSVMSWSYYKVNSFGLSTINGFKVHPDRPGSPTASSLHCHLFLFQYRPNNQPQVTPTVQKIIKNTLYEVPMVVI